MTKSITSPEIGQANAAPMVIAEAEIGDRFEERSASVNKSISELIAEVRNND